MQEGQIKSKMYHDVQIEEHKQNEWQFVFTKSGILNSQDLDMLQDALVLQGIPDLLYGNNTGLLFNEKERFGFFVNGKDALYFCNLQTRQKHFFEITGPTTNVNHISLVPSEVQLKMASQWKKNEKHKDIKILDKISDTFYATPYKGSVVNANQVQFWYQKFEEIQTMKGKSILEGQLDEKKVQNELEYLKQVFEVKPQNNGNNKPNQVPYSEPTQDQIPVHNLSEKNPIVWASHIVLFEDELGDNGLSTCEFRFRVMKDCFFGLIRNYVRVDDVIIRIYDTRIYHDFTWNYILREFTAREEQWEKIKAAGFGFTPQWSVDPQQSFMIQNFLPVTCNVHDKIYFKM